MTPEQQKKDDKKSRARRRNFAEERKTLVLSCKARIEILQSIEKDAPPAAQVIGQISAYRAVLKLMGEEAPEVQP